jgi:hypothetical protein
MLWQPSGYFCTIDDFEGFWAGIDDDDDILICRDSWLALGIKALEHTQKSLSI